MYIRLRSGSTTGVDHTPPPDGPQSCVPAADFVVFCGSGIVYVFQSTFPVAASSALTLPRKVQHSYDGMAAVPSSIEAAGTYTRLPANATAPVIIASRCASIFVFQRSFPFRSREYALALASPKYSALAAPVPPTTGVERTPASASNAHTMQPDFASSAYTTPLRLPTYARLPATLTCDPDADTPGIPKAHFSLRRGTAAGDNPAVAAGAKRVFRVSPPKPFHDAPDSAAGGDAVHQADFGMTS